MFPPGRDCAAPAATLSLGVERSGHVGQQKTLPKCRRSTTGLRGSTVPFRLDTGTR